MFGATKSKFPDVTFEQIDVSEHGSHAEEKQKYGVQGIPCVVFLDQSGNVLFSGIPYGNEEGFASQIQQYR
ncbi:MAG: hypothetical protein JSS83_19090 [Cyanobacteria bacterium SZAS LIN-3]|nr:hypothetical protein [Cyanobacteria bacterium SZAS LIN-3]MBS2007074.1 hypothetical protein [Cyanobacteria bacterium SZAS TMP-1]